MSKRLPKLPNLYPIANYNYIFKYLGRTENPMSQGVLVKNKNCSILSSDSLMQELKYDNVSHKWTSIGCFYRRKVYYNRQKKLIWCIAGLDICSVINDRIANLDVNYMRNLEHQLKLLQEDISLHLQSFQLNDKFIDVKILLCLSIHNRVYTCLISSASDDDINFNQVSFLYDFPLSNWFLH